MSRPQKQRRVCQLPTMLEFSPNSTSTVESIEMTIDEYECIRLIDQLKLTQQDCALQMNVARTTVQSIYDSARTKLADALIHGKRLVIHGGNYTLCSHSNTCCGKNCVKRNCQTEPCANANPGCLHCQKRSTPPQTHN